MAINRKKLQLTLSLVAVLGSAIFAAQVVRSNYSAAMDNRYDSIWNWRSLVYTKCEREYLLSHNISRETFEEQSQKMTNACLAKKLQDTWNMNCNSYGFFDSPPTACLETCRGVNTIQECQSASLDASLPLYLDNRIIYFMSSAKSIKVYYLIAILFITLMVIRFGEKIAGQFMRWLQS